MKVYLIINEKHAQWHTEDGKYGIDSYMSGNRTELLKIMRKHIRETMKKVNVKNYEIIEL